MKFPLEVVDGQHYGYGSDFIVDADNHIIADPVPHDAAEIVRRCNAFDELITALKNFMEWEDPFWDGGEWIEQLIAKYEVPSTENRAP